MDAWIAETAASIGAAARADMEALVAISSPSGDVEGAERAIAAVVAGLPAGAEVERPACSSPGHAPDLLARVRGTGGARILLLGHVDTVVAHAAHRPVLSDPTEPDRLIGSGTVDMKGGDALALGVLRALAATRTAELAEVVLLLVCDEEWRTAPFTHVERFAGFDACLCFEGGELTADGQDAVVVRRKAAGTISVRATGRSSHSGSAPDRGANALLALAAAAQAVAGCHDPGGPEHLTAVPTVLHSGDAFNVVPAAGELICDVRADRLEAFEAIFAALPDAVGGATLDARPVRRWPGMDAAVAVGPVLDAAARALGRPIVGTSRGGASDASHFAAAIALTVDGLGPLGGRAHAPEEHVWASSLTRRAEVALAVVDAVLARTRA